MNISQTAFVMAIVLTAAGAACAQGGRDAGKTPAPTTDAQTTSTSPCAPLETRTANAPEQKPAFPGQTRACGVKSGVAFDVAVVAKGLERPWAVEPLPNGDFLVTEKPGRLRIVSAGGEVGPPIGGLLPVGQGGVSAASAQGGLPPITAQGQGGLLDVALSPSFARDRTIFWSFSEQREGGSGTSVARGVLTEDRRNLEQVRVIFRALPTYANGLHFGSRLAFGPDGMLYVTLGDRFDRPNRPKVQQLDAHLGKLIRINPDGSAPADNPFAGRAGALPEIWDLGHRNVQSAAFDERGRLWTVEHGAKGGDELNLIEKGKNYGWPLVTYGTDYDGSIISKETARANLEAPVLYWNPSIAVSGLSFYTGDAFPDWKGNLFVGAMMQGRTRATGHIQRITFTDGRPIQREPMLTDLHQRIRDVRPGPDGRLYVLTDENPGALLRIERQP